MSVLSVVKDVCFAVGVNPPASLFGASTQPRTQAELLSLANEVARRIAGDTRDWTKLKQFARFDGDAVFDTGNQIWVGSTAFDLPANFHRMPFSANVWKATNPMKFIPDADEWLQRRINNLSSSPGWGEWTIIGGQMHIFPTMHGPSTDPSTGAVTPAEMAQFVYLSRNCVELASGGFGDVFVEDGDRFALDERLLKLGMVWQWKANKGSPYAEDMGTYSDALVMAMGADSPAPIIVDAPRRTVEGWNAGVW